VFGDAVEQAGRFDVAAGGRRHAGMLAIDLICTDPSTKIAPEFLDRFDLLLEDEACRVSDLYIPRHT
jgi:hypothetical protein